ncbi:hypothetical protein FRZ61_15980 [Hypericibacter adhaerens]|jgi:hypothetical protein|uniref:Uncharacterized protein n=1 Tax=Hypericibacter adhaerens TaxID=2602016 RepID=A0A5J6MW30_9PROT|nr:hypothetical protein [Hypericibacter adhaerens]QEX21669.1 hypothetical protein FRZ61_15980 [Hypericibacter adhaerens]
MVRSLTCLSLFALAVVFAHPASAERLKLSGSEIKQLLSDKTAYGYRGDTAYSVYFSPDGTMIEEQKDGKKRIGHWVAKQTQHCVTWQDGVENCMSLYRDRDQIFWVDPATGAMNLAQIKSGKNLLADSGQ